MNEGKSVIRHDNRMKCAENISTYWDNKIQIIQLFTDEVKCGEVRWGYYKWWERTQVKEASVLNFHIIRFVVITGSYGPMWYNRSYHVITFIDS